MKRAVVLGIVALSALASASPTASDIAAGKQAFVTVARVLQSPRCQNCHPAGDRPLHGDAGRPHRFSISRRSVSAGLDCGACHQQRNSEALGVIGGPPGASHWGLPSSTTPMVFEGRSVRALCEQLKDRSATGGRDLNALREHLASDALVKWAWAPGGNRSKPPVSHAELLAAFRTWVASDGACP